MFEIINKNLVYVKYTFISTLFFGVVAITTPHKFLATFYIKCYSENSAHSIQTEEMILRLTDPENLKFIEKASGVRNLFKLFSPKDMDGDGFFNVAKYQNAENYIVINYYLYSERDCEHVYKAFASHVESYVDRSQEEASLNIFRDKIIRQIKNIKIAQEEIENSENNGYFFSKNFQLSQIYFIATQLDSLYYKIGEDKQKIIFSSPSVVGGIRIKSLFLPRLLKFCLLGLIVGVLFGYLIKNRSLLPD